MTARRAGAPGRATRRSDEYPSADGCVGRHRHRSRFTGPGRRDEAGLARAGQAAVGRADPALPAELGGAVMRWALGALALTLVACGAPQPASPPTTVTKTVTAAPTTMPTPKPVAAPLFSSDLLMSNAE